VAGTLCALEEAASVAAMMERLAGEARLAMAA